MGQFCITLSTESDIDVVKSGLENCSYTNNELLDVKCMRFDKFCVHKLVLFNLKLIWDLHLYN